MEVVHQDGLSQCLLDGLQAVVQVDSVVHHHLEVAVDMEVQADGQSQCLVDGLQEEVVEDTHQVDMEEVVVDSHQAVMEEEVVDTHPVDMEVVSHPHTVLHLLHTVLHLPHMVPHQVAPQGGLQVVHGNQQKPFTNTHKTYKEKISSVD